MKIETERLIIQSFVESDIDEYAKIVNDGRVTKYLINTSPRSYQEASDFVKEIITEESETGIARYAVILKENNKLIGFCGFKAFDDYTDFGWLYGFEHWGNGYGSEAALAVFDYGIQELQLTDMVSGTVIENVASVKIIEKLGFEYKTHREKNGNRLAIHSQFDINP
ncbi:MAG: GNAT family N-acetyltransferase [Chitinispirillia bacterium]|jgi:RimJ/RimL family protein N-acetyltransferase